MNPASEVATLRVPKPNAEYLREDEVRAVLAHASDRWRNFVAVAINTGLRRGELAGLRKGDVHLDEGNPRIHVQRSWGRETTKRGKGRVVPLCAECVPFLRAAVAVSPSDLVFPRMTGDRRGEMLDPEALDLPNVVRRPWRTRGWLRAGCTSAARG